MHRHLRFYNDPHRYTAIKDDHPRYHELERGAKTFEDIDIVFEAPPETEIGRVVHEKGHDERGDLLVLKRPVKFVGRASSSGVQDDKSPYISGEIDFGLHLSSLKQEVDGKNFWNLKLGRKQ